MASLSPEEREAVKDALGSQLRKEEFDRALGKALRRKGLGFDRYIEIVSELRETSRKEGTPIEDVARRLVEGL
jgi:hypothetical protein